MASNQTGSCTVTPGSPTVIFSVSSDMDNIEVGDLFKVNYDSSFYTIASVDGTGYKCTLSSRYSNSSFIVSVVNEQIDTGDGSSSYSGTLIHVPVIPGTTIFADGSNVESFSDDGSGILTGSLGGTGTINFETGVVSLTFNSVVPAGVAIYATTYNYGIPLTSTNFQIVRDYTPEFNWPEPYSTDQNPETIIRQALRAIDTDLYTHAAQVFNISVFDSDTSVTVGDGKKAFTIPYFMDAYVLTDAIASVYSKGVTGSTDIQIRKRSDGSNYDLLLPKITIGDEYFSRDGTAIVANSSVEYGDQIFIDVDAVHSSPPTGLSVTITFQKG